MSDAEPVDLLSGFPGWATKFELLYRQEQSRVAGGRTFVKDLGDPLWTATYLTHSLTINQLDYWRARLDELEGGLIPFRAVSPSRCYPIAYPRGAGVPVSGVRVAALGEDNKSLRLSGLPSGYRISVGDLIEIAGSGLYRVTSEAVAGVAWVLYSGAWDDDGVWVDSVPWLAGAGGGGAVSPVFSVRPHLWPGTVSGAVVTLVQPGCAMSIVPGTISTDADAATGRGVVTFQAIEAR